MTENPSGAFTFVLHAHIPYVRMAGRWPHGEEWLLEAAVDTYLPLLCALHDLAADRVRYELTIELTPVLVEQLADPDILTDLDAYLADQRDRAASDVRRFSRDGDAQREGTARFYLDHCGAMLDAFRGRFGRDLIGAFRSLQDSGHVELATSAATHGYLPLFEQDSSVRAQIAQGVRAHERHFGSAPEAFWLPECGYRPADGERRGLETFLDEQGVRVFFADTHMVERGATVSGRAPDPFAAYRVGASGVAVIARNRTALRQVWSSAGYPGDFAYREFNSRDSESGHRYWRVTGAETPLEEKAHYDHAAAFACVAEHARHFVGVVEYELRAYNASSARYGIMAGLYDAELFGHWWFEGVAWLKDVLRWLAASETVELCTAARYVQEHPPEDAIALAAGSWGVDGDDSTWMNGRNSWMWPIITKAQRRMQSLAATYEAADGASRAALDQLGRELLLLESSDWPYLVTTGQASAYAERRFTQHAERFDALAAMMDGGDVAPAYLADLQERDKLFPDIRVQDFA